ncbi:sodium-translocating pyrophosphatase [Candidatus Saccharibacteria bacterium]|nr:sodium-translocating pyrophosphatase [Candidatus Saccharibacteria bacterium]
MLAAIFLVGAGVIASLLFCLDSFKRGRKMAGGTPEMSEIAEAIRQGATAFLKREFSVDVPIIFGIALLFSILFTPWAGLATLIGATMSSFAGLVGMRAAVIYNERVANEARLAVLDGKGNAEDRAGKVAIRGGSVMGTAVGGFALLGLLIVYLVVGMAFMFARPENLVETTSIVGLKFVMISQVLVCYALGCSIMAVFNRLGGGIFTKGADMGSDLVGKTELGIPEDDPRNPATIADCVGDNVGDVNGNGSDLLESTIGAITACTILPITIYTALINSPSPMTNTMVTRMMEYPIAVAGLGLIACVLGIIFVLARKSIGKLARELNLSLWSSAGIIAVGSGVLAYFFFAGQSTVGSQFRFGWISPWISSMIGIVAGIAMGLIAERYTSDRYKETRKIAALSKEGPALVIVGGLSLGWRSCLPACLVLGFSLFASSYFSGNYGSAIAAVGMLSFVAATVTVDTYGPISDNAGGIAEMAKLDKSVRRITDSLDSLGNTTAAVGKGFAIGSGVLAALAMMMLFSNLDGSNGGVDITNALALFGAIAGGGLMQWLSGVMMDAVNNNAAEMVDEVRRQVKEKPGILDGTERPDSGRCVDICTRHALKQMVKPVIVSLSAPIVGGMLFGPLLVAGLLIGAILIAVVTATATANSGGAWDNSKKLVKATQDELVALYGEEQWGGMHRATVIADTIGDPFKDVVGPNQDIMIKMMATVSVIMLPLFTAFNLFSVIA